MAKRTYCPMTIEHEALEMNQAVAACDYVRVSATGGADCDQCRSALASHGWDVYDNDGIVNTGETMIIVSTGGTYDGACGSNNAMFPTAKGNTYWYTVQGGEVNGGVVTKILINMGMITQGTAMHLGMVDSNGNVPGLYSVETASTIMNS